VVAHITEERRLRESENRMLSKIFGPKWDDVTKEWRKLHNKELNDLYCLLNSITYSMVQSPS